MKHIYLEVSENEYTMAKEIGFFEVTDELRMRLQNMIRSQYNRSTSNDKHNKASEE